MKKLSRVLPCARSLQRMSLFTIFLFVCFFSVAVFSEAQTNTLRISLEEAVQTALKKNLQLNIGQYALQKVRIARNSSWFALLPTKVDLSLSYLRTDKKPEPSPQNPDPSQTSLSANLDFSINITAAQVTKGVIGIFQSIQDYKAQKISFDELTFNTAVQTQKLYFDLLIARKALRVLQEQLAVSRVDVREAERAYGAGLQDGYSMLKTKLAFLNAEQAYDAQVDKEAKARRFLLVVLGHSAMFSDVVLTDDVPDISKFDITAILSLTSANNAKSAKLRASLQSLELQRWNTAFDYMPSLSLNYSLGTRLANADRVDWFNGDNWNADNGKLTMSVSISIMKYLPWSSTSKSLRTLNKSIHAKKMEIAQQGFTNENELESNKSRLKLLMNTLENNQTQVAVAQRAYELGQEAYKNGLITVKEYLTTKAELHNTQIKHITQQAEVIKAILDIKVLANARDGVY